MSHNTINSPDIDRCTNADFEAIFDIVNQAADAYREVIPEDRWKEPYMPREELRHEIDAGVVFWGYRVDGQLVGIMGIQDVKDVTLIRHAYVRTSQQKSGIGGMLIGHLCAEAQRPMLVGTWADATWAVRFYQKHGFRLVPVDTKNRLLKTYWDIPERQVETSVVLADARWLAENPGAV